MDTEEKVAQWEEYHEALSKLFNEVNDIFCTKCFYDDNLIFHEIHYQPDEDTPHIRKLVELLKPAVEFTSKHLNELNKLWDLECEAKLNAEKAFEAWKRNLCPLVMKNVTRYMSSNSFNRFETYDEIAFYLTRSEINYARTKEAINLWQAHKFKNVA